jgi:hypothetical protein
VADRVYRYRAISPTAPQLAPMIFPIEPDGTWIGTLVVGAPSTDVFVDVVIDEVNKGALDAAMKLSNFEPFAEAPPGIDSLPASYAPLQQVQAAPVGGRVFQVDWYQSYPPGGPGVGLSRRRIDTWEQSKLTRTTITDYWRDGTPIATKTYTYETTAAGERVEVES